MGAFIGEKRLPVVNCQLPLAALRCMGPTINVVECLLVGRDQTRPGSAFNRHVADGHPAFHRKRFDGRTRVFDHMASTARGAGLADDRQGNVLGGDARGNRAVDLDQHVLRFLGNKGLRGQHMLDLGGADTMGQRSERAVGGGVAVAADDGHAGLGPTLFGTDDVHNALADIIHVIKLDPEVCRVLPEFLDLDARLFVLDALGPIHVGWHVVIWHGNGLARCTDTPARHPQPFERLGAGHLVNKVTIDVQQGGSVIGFVDEVVVPDLVVERLGGGHGISPDGQLAGAAAWSRAEVVGAGLLPSGGGFLARDKAPRKACAVCDIEKEGHGVG